MRGMSTGRAWIAIDDDRCSFCHGLRHEAGRHAAPRDITRAVLLDVGGVIDKASREMTRLDFGGLWHDYRQVLHWRNRRGRG